VSIAKEDLRAFDTLIEAIPESMLNAADVAFIPAEFSADPHSFLGPLRDRSAGIVERVDGRYDGVEIPNVWGHDLGKPHFVSLGFDAMTQIAGDFKRIVNHGAYGPHVEVHGATINTLDGNDHRALRRLFDGAIFGRKSMEQRVSSIVDPTVELLLGRIRLRLEQQQPVDIRRDLALPLVFSSMARIIGVPREQLAHFVALSDAAFGAPMDMQAAIRAIAALDDYFRVELEKRKQQGGDDMMSIMLQAEEGGRRLTDAEIVQHCRFLLPGGIETTWRQTANMLTALLLHPEQFRAVTEDPALVEPAVEEALRWLPSGFVVPRMAAEDAEVCGVKIPAGAAVLGIQGVANRDPKRWEHADRFDIRRKPLSNLTFHMGPHYCMGQNLARYTLRKVLALVTQRLPELCLACEPEEIFTQGFGVRCPGPVPVRLQ